MAILSASLATVHRWPHSLLPRVPGKVSGRHVGGCAGARVLSGSLSRQVPCRGYCLVVPGSLSLTGPRWDAWRVAASSLRCLGWPSRQDPLAGVLSPWLKHFVLEWLQRNHGGPWRSPGKPCRGVLQLPVHKFGILGYPYSSTPTGAPGPGPHTVPSAVGPGPKQGTGTRDLGHAYLTPYPPRPPQRHASNVASWERSWVVSLFGRAKRSPPPPL